MDTARRYITTPIYYVNDRPHIGHVYTSTICDVWARFMRFAGRDVFFLTGTDEHGLKVEKSAKERGLSPKELADENAGVFRDVMRRFNLSNDDFIRTTDPAHERQVRALVKKLLDNGSAYLGEFEGWYDEGQEEYYTETKAKDLAHRSPVTGKPLVRARERNYYFRLSAFQERLERLLEEHPEFVRPDARRNEVLGRLREGLQDVPISRTNFTWGIQMPGDPEHVIYVWIDALMNYVTALGLGEPQGTTFAARAAYWPASLHVIGKEILWFHAVVWPAILMALELPLPRCVFAHSFWISEGQKMSKSLGNFIDLEAIDRYVEVYGLDMWRYFLVTQGPLGATDADFSASQFHEVYNTDLVNTVGNCASRVTAMICKYFGGDLPSEDKAVGKAAAAGSGERLQDAAGAAVRATFDAMERFDLTAAVASALGLIRRVDAFINETQPFKIAADPAKRGALASILAECLESIRISSLLLWCVMPAKVEDLWTALGLAIDPAEGRLAELARWSLPASGARVTKVALFPRVELASGEVG